VRELRRAAEAAVRPSKVPARSPARRRASGSSGSHGVAAGAGRHLREGLRQRAGCSRTCAAVLAPVLGDAPEQLRERRQPVAGVLAGNRCHRRTALVLRREEHRQRPAAVAPGQHLVRELVDPVEVGALLAVDLDVDEVRVHQRRGGVVLERFVRHHVAPVAGGVADRQQDRLAFARAPVRAPLAPTGTSRPGCRRAAAGRGWSRWRAGWASTSDVHCRGIE
jgi:hypothetical protein